MHQRTLDQITRIIAEHKTRRAALMQLTTLALGLIRGGFGVQRASAQALPLGSPCAEDSECAETEICSGATGDPTVPLTYCCRPGSQWCSVDDECCGALTCSPVVDQGQGTCGLPYPSGGTTTTLPSHATTCTLAELYPGYPGYRGFVTGLSGSGEVACVEQLQQGFPWFDRDREDQENVAAAVRLGLAGGPKDWVWENWLSIEAERGLPITCYTCAQEQIAAGEQYRAGPADPNDIRLLVGSFNSNELLFRVAGRNGIEMWAIDSFVTTDYQLRAVAWTAYPGRQLNAWDLQTVYDYFVAAIMGPVGESAPFSYPFWIALGQGGYAPTPSHAAHEDQVFLVTTAMEAQALTSGERMGNALRVRVDALVRQWASERAQGSTQGLGEFLCPIFQQCIKPSTP
jgi:hypothetical protein